MYIGSTGVQRPASPRLRSGGQLVDEALAGRADRIEVTLHPDNSVTVSDNGSGIPVDAMADTGLPAVIVLTKLHAGGKFGGEGYKVSGGLHGVGVSVVNALSEWLKVEVRRDGKISRQEFARGEPTTELIAAGKTESKKDTGTTITFFPTSRSSTRTSSSGRWTRCPASARDGVPDPRPPDRHHRRARGRGAARVPLRGWNQGPWST